MFEHFDEQAIAEGLAQRIVTGTVPDALLDHRVLSLDLASLIAGTPEMAETDQATARYQRTCEQVKDVLKGVFRPDEKAMTQATGLVPSEGPPPDW